MSAHPPKARKRTVIAALALLVLAFVGLAEIALRLSLPRSDFLLAELREDPIMGLLIAPHDNGHDRLGLRNPQHLTQADIVAIGDSNTYGINATSSQSWPGHLQQMMGRPTYNMGLGGFGPLQYLHALREWAPSFKPKVVVVAFYMGNDLMDAYNLAHDHAYWRDYRLSVRPKGALTASDIEGTREWEEQEQQRSFRAWRDWLSMNSMAYSVVRHLVLTPLANTLRQRRAVAYEADVQMPWTDPRFPTVKQVFGSRVRALSMNPSIAAVAEGLQISERAIQDMARVAEAQKVRLVFAFIPTKERVYCDALKATAATGVPAAHWQICQDEPQNVARLMAAAEAAGVPAVDASRALIAAAQRGESLYPQHVDGHAISAGYRVIAEPIAQVVKSLF